MGKHDCGAQEIWVLSVGMMNGCRAVFPVKEKAACSVYQAASIKFTVVKPI
jgi:hypothetical protein